MAQWTHVSCTDCWYKQNPNRDPVRMIETKLETCCLCGRLTTSGIFVRRRPDAVAYCKCEERE